MVHQFLTLFAWANNEKRTVACHMSMQRLRECVTHSCEGVCVCLCEKVQKSALLNFVWSTGIPVKPITPLRHLHAPRVLLGLTLRPSHTLRRVCITHHTFNLVLLLDLFIHYKLYTANFIGLNSSHDLRVSEDHFTIFTWS